MASSCSLDHGGQGRQLARYRALAPDVESVERAPRSLVVAFRDGYDRALLDEAIAIERECCPFLGIVVGERRLSISIADADHAPMLDVFAEALAPAAAAR